MGALQTIVCIKQVPDTNEVKMDPERGTLIREGVPAIINPFDTYAIEEGIRLKEAHGGKTTVLTMGPPQALDAIIDTTPVWKPVMDALLCLKPGGRLVINAIRKESKDNDLLMQMDYPRHLWMEKEIKSVANVARRDVKEFLKIAGSIPIKPEFQEYPLEDANAALMELKQRKIRGAKVLRIA